LVRSARYYARQQLGQGEASAKESCHELDDDGVLDAAEFGV